MDSTTSQKLAVNASNAWKMASNYVMAAAAIIWAAYLALPVTCPDVGQPAGECLSQHALQVWVSTKLHVPALLLPLITGALGIFARLYPQKAVTPNLAAAKSADAQQDSPTS